MWEGWLVVLSMTVPLKLLVILKPFSLYSTV